MGNRASAGSRPSPARLAMEIGRRLEEARVQDTEHLRAIRREYTSRLRPEAARYIIRTALHLVPTPHRWVGYELIRYHPNAFESISSDLLRRLGRGIDSWWTTDAFARTLSGPLWLRRRVPDAEILQWARSRNSWWRRAALVSTVALNVRSHGGSGDSARTLRVCRLLAADRHPMVAKALSWALRALVPQDPQAVAAFLGRYGSELAPVVRREVHNKLRTGLKNPRHCP